jgi:phasin family protein
MAGKAQTQTTEAFESISVAGNKALKDGYDKAVAAMGDINAFSKSNIEALVASASCAGKGAEKINTRVANYTKQAIEDGVEVAKKAASAKSVQELIELQSDWAKSSLDTYMGEVNKLADLYAASLKDAFKPLNERVTAAVELFQAQR